MEVYFARSPENFCDIFLFDWPGDLALKITGIFGVFLFLWSAFPRKRSTKSPGKKNRENLKQNSKKDSGRKFKKFGTFRSASFMTLWRYPQYSWEFPDEILAELLGSPPGLAEELN